MDTYLGHYQSPNFIVHNSSGEADSSSAREEITPHFWNLKVHYCVHKVLPSVSVTMHIKSAPSHSVGLRYILILYSHISLRLPNVLSFRFPLKHPVQISHLPHTGLMHCKSHPVYLIF